MLYLVNAALSLGYTLTGSPIAQSTRAISPNMLYGEPRPVQIIPSVLPADWANVSC